MLYIFIYLYFFVDFVECIYKYVVILDDEMVIMEILDMVG